MFKFLFWSFYFITIPSLAATTSTRDFQWWDAEWDTASEASADEIKGIWVLSLKFTDEVSHDPGSNQNTFDPSQFLNEDQSQTWLQFTGHIQTETGLSMMRASAFNIGLRNRNQTHKKVLMNPVRFSIWTYKKSAAVRNSEFDTKAYDEYLCRIKKHRTPQQLICRVTRHPSFLNSDILASRQVMVFSPTERRPD